MDENALPRVIIGGAIEVQKHLGPGLLESAYAKCLKRELSLRGVAFESEKAIPVQYKGEEIDCGYRLDFLVGGSVIVELKAVDELALVHHAQVLTYLKLTGCKLGLLLNFNVPLMRDGVKRIVIGL